MKQIPTWFWMLIALAQTGLAVAQWTLWLGWKELEWAYSSEILAGARFNFGRVRHELFMAALMTIVAAFVWARAIWSAEV